MELPKEVESFVNNLVPTDVGVDTVGNYIVHYEGFTDECNDGHDDESIDEVYAEVFQDFDDRQGSEALIRGVANDNLGCDYNPVLYSVYSNVSESVRGNADPGGVAVNMLNDPKISSVQKEQIRKKFMKDYNMDPLPIPGDFINHSELGNVRVLKIIDVDMYGGPAEYKIEDNNGKTFPISFDELIDDLTYMDTGNAPQPLKNSFDFQLVDKEIAEARLYRTTSGFNQLTGQSVAELLYLNTLITYMMLKDDKQHDYARAYAKQSTQYGKYTLFRSHATDLYLLAYLVCNPDSKSIKLRNKMASTKHLKSLNFDKRTHWQFMYKIANDRASDTLASPYLFRLESQLKIKKSMYKQWRRLIMDWENLRYIQRQSVTTRIVQELRRLGRGSEVMAPLTSMLKYKKYRIRDKTPKTDPVRRVAGAAAGAVAGRYAGKKIAQKFGKNVDKYKRAGTGLGAIAGYWASGRQRQK